MRIPNKPAERPRTKPSGRNPQRWRRCPPRSELLWGPHAPGFLQCRDVGGLQRLVMADRFELSVVSRRNARHLPGKGIPNDPNNPRNCQTIVVNVAQQVPTSFDGCRNPTTHWPVIDYVCLCSNDKRLQDKPRGRAICSADHRGKGFPANGEGQDKPTPFKQNEVTLQAPVTANQSNRTSGMCSNAPLVSTNAHTLRDPYAECCCARGGQIMSTNECHMANACKHHPDQPSMWCHRRYRLARMIGRLPSAHSRWSAQCHWSRDLR